jgi:diguanylate cyclase (GGDEF)-like protein/PAS domain S-box-containing protein
MIAGLLALGALGAVVALLAGRALARARASEHLYRTLAANTPSMAVALIDRDLRFTLFQGDALERHGWLRSEVVGLHIAEVVPPERIEELQPRVEAALAGTGSRMEWRSMRADATFRMDIVPFWERPGGEPTHALLALCDITEESALRRSLDEQQMFFKAVLAQLGPYVAVVDADGRLLDFGSGVYGGARHLHPLEWAEHFGLRQPDGTPMAAYEAPLLRALRGETVKGCELRVTGGGLDLTTVVSGGPVTGPDGRVIGAVTANVDLTAYRDAERRLRHSEERYRRVVESMTDCVFETDQLGRWTYLSETWEETTGYAIEDCLGRPAADYVHPDDRAAHARACAPLLAGKVTALKTSHRFVTAAGSERWVEVQLRAISSQDGLPTGFAGVMRDVTDERRLHQRAEAEQSVLRLLAGTGGLDEVAHALIEALGSGLEWDGAELWRIGPDERLRRLAAWTAPGVELTNFLTAGETREFEVGEGFPGLAWMSREPLWSADVRGDCKLSRRAEGVKDGIRSAAALPLRAAGEPLGVVILVSRALREPEPGLVGMLDHVGAHVAQVLQRREAEQRAAQQAADLRRLSEVAHELAAETDMLAARTSLCRAVRDVTRATSVTLWEPANEELAVTAAVGATVHGITVGLGVRSAVVDAFLSCDLVFVPDVPGDPENASWREVPGAGSAAWVPVVRDERCVGVLAVGWDEPRPALPPRDEELLRLLAAEAAITIHRTDLLARVQATARTDALTGLPNRRVWDEDLDRELERARRHGHVLCLAMLDLDRFKAYNDRHGHQAGDRLLAQTAAAWRPLLRATDTLARYGGEEFALLLPHSDEQSALAVVERLLEAVPFGQTASAGIAVWDGEEGADELLARADAALYEAKRAGRARALLAG